MRFFLARGVKPNGGAGTGVDGLHWAANRGQLETVRLLIAHGADLESRNRYGGTALGMTLWSAFNEPRPAHLEMARVVFSSRMFEGDPLLNFIVFRINATPPRTPIQFNFEYRRTHGRHPP